MYLLKKININALLVFPVVFFFIGGTLISAQSTEGQPRDRAYDRETVKDRRVVPYPYLREADVFFEKRIWRDIFVKEKMNLHFAYPNYEGKKNKPLPLIRVVMEAAKSGDLTVYDPITGDDFKQPMTPEQVKSIGHSVDTQWVTNPVTGQEERKIVEQNLNLENIKKFRVKEDWIFDKERSEMYVRIIGVAPYRAKYDDNGNFVADVAMFWIYYPDLRPILANAYAYNMYNDAANLTWNDVFEMRLFESKIVKESNVYDRYIEDYKAGKEALYEAQRVKQDLFEFEHDLWSY